MKSSVQSVINRKPDKQDPSFLGRFFSEDDLNILEYGLRAQSRMLPFALCFFAIGLPIYLWAALLMNNTVMAPFSLVLFCVNWACFYAIHQKIHRINTDQDKCNTSTKNTRRIFFYQSLGAFIWVVFLNLVAVMASISGLSSHVFLIVCAGAAVGIIFFCAPILMLLLVMGSLAAAGPIIGLYMIKGSQELAQILTGGMALAMAMGFVLNRHLIEHYRLEYNHKKMEHEREATRLRETHFTQSKIALMQTLSHEVFSGLKGLETCLNQAHGYLSRAPLPRQTIEQAIGQTLSLQSILKTTLDSDIAEGGSLALQTTPINIEDLVQNLDDRFSPLAQSKGLTLSLPSFENKSPGAPIADFSRTEQILSHLLSNAINYTQIGRVELQIHRVDEAFMRFEVIDSGAGLHEDEIALAFEPHTRIERTSLGHLGAGLGLSLSASLARLMGGVVGAQSTIRLGSKFWLDLPFDKAATALASQRSPLETAPAKGHNTQSLRVLLIANESLRAAQIRNALERLGHRCITSTNLERGLNLAQKAEIDACVMSNTLIEGVDYEDDGVETFISHLRQTQQSARLAIIALLPNGDQVESLKHLGVTPLFMPLNEDGLRRALLNTEP